MTTVGTGKHTYDLVQDWARFPEGEPTGVVCSVAIDAQGLVYVAQRIGSPVLVFDDSGNYIRSWDSAEITDPHGFYIADDVAYVADRSDSVVLKCTLEGKVLQTVGQRGIHSDTGCEKRGDLVLRAAGPFNNGYSPKTATCERMVAWDGRLGALDVNTPRAGAFGEVRVVVQPATTSGCPGRCRFGCRQGSGGDCCAGSSWGRVPR